MIILKKYMALKDERNIQFKMCIQLCKKVYFIQQLSAKLSNNVHKTVSNLCHHLNRKKKLHNKNFQQQLTGQ